MRRLKSITSVASSTGSVEDTAEPAFKSCDSLRIDLDGAFHMNLNDLFNSTHMKFDV